MSSEIENSGFAEAKYQFSGNIGDPHQYATLEVLNLILADIGEARRYGGPKLVYKTEWTVLVLVNKRLDQQERWHMLTAFSLQFLLKKLRYILYGVPVNDDP